LTLAQNIIIAPIEILLLQSFFDSLFAMLHNSGTWFISCLLFCYLLFPWLKEMLIQLATKKWLIFFLLYFITALSPFVVKAFGISSIYSNPVFRLFEFAIGMIIADYAIKNSNKTKKYTIFYLTIALTTLFIGINLLNQNALFTNDYPMYNIISVPVFAVLIYFMTYMNNKTIIRISSSSLIQYLSKISFSFFLAQFFTFSIIKKLLTFSWFSYHTNIVLILVSLLINLLISILMYELIEKPFEKILTKKLAFKRIVSN